jgi:hypothetical protein
MVKAKISGDYRDCIKKGNDEVQTLLLSHRKVLSGCIAVPYCGPSAHSNRLIAESRYQRGTPQDTNGRNFVPKHDLTR